MFSNSSSNTIAFILLVLMFLLMFFSTRGDSVTYDEHAHVPAGYSYLAFKDRYLNFEHPPLIKDLSALPLLFLNLNFPTESQAWKDRRVDAQWHIGKILLYESGNDADQIIFWARLPIILLAIFFGWFLFKTARNLYGNDAALFALFFFVTSPTVIAHSRLVTTDLGAAFGFFFGIITFHRFLEKNNIKTLIFAGTSLGIALLLKFSTVLLIPLYLLFGFLWVFLTRFNHLKSLYSFKSRATHLIDKEVKMAQHLTLIFLIAFLIILIVYQYHVWNYPPERQVKDTQHILLSAFGINSFGEQKEKTQEIPLVAKTVVWLADKPILRGFSQYLLGLLSCTVCFSKKTTYFWGEISNSGWKSYFPMAYLLKEQLAFHILTLFVLISAILLFLKKHKRTLISFIEWPRDNFALTMCFIFIGTYWIIAIFSTLNLGIRHVLPTFPFIFLLVAYGLANRFQMYHCSVPPNYKKRLYSLYERLIKSNPKHLFVSILLFWLLIGIILSFPFYLSYFNILGGGSAYGWRFNVDSNYDWGQDLKRLKKFVDKNNIKKINLDYFGSGGNEAPYYYLGEKFEPWLSAKGKPQGWFAISATHRQLAFGKPVKGVQRKTEDSYSWLKQYEPVARAGQTIFIYYID
ncbi:MAG: ArnT family glycosyltransferase [Candidatus Brocadiales bacterium]